MNYYDRAPANKFDDYVTYNGYALVNELYEDDEGFYKNTWMWGEVNGDYVDNVKILKGLSSNSYAKYSEAKEVFTALIDGLTTT
jgi:hypothetical protein